MLSQTYCLTPLAISLRQKVLTFAPVFLRTSLPTLVGLSGQGCFVMAWFSCFHHTQTTTQHTDNQHTHRQTPNTQTTNQHADNQSTHRQPPNTQTTTQDKDNRPTHRQRTNTQTSTQHTDNHPTHKQPTKTQTTTQKT
jgi:hypothetical protein